MKKHDAFFNKIQTLLRSIKYIKYLKKDLIPQGKKAVTLTSYKTLFGCAACGLCYNRKLTHQPLDLILFYWNRSRNIKTVILYVVVTKRETLIIDVRI